MTKTFVGIDIGGTNVRAVAFEDLNNANFINQLSRTHQTGERSYEEDYSALVKTIREVGGRNITGIGLGLPGVISPGKTGIVSATYLPHWEGKLVAEHLSKEFGCVVRVDHDQVCSAFGEAVYGGTAGKDFALVGWGTGFGGAFIESNSEKTVVRAIQNAREYEYFDIWDQDCGGFAIAQEFGKPASDFDDSDWDNVMDRFKQHLGRYLSRPEIHAKTVVFSGGVAVKQAARLLAVCDELKAQSPIIADIGFKVVTHGENSGACGAIALLRSDCSVR